MNRRMDKTLGHLSAALVALALAAAPSQALEINLRATSTTVAMPGGAEVTMFAYALGDASATVPGPPITVPPGEGLTINLYNDLPGGAAASVTIPGQVPPTNGPGGTRQVTRNGDGRIRSFVHETASATTGVYTWDSIRAGTYLYHSGTHPAVQVQMGLYGALKNDVSAGEAYPGVNYAADATLVFSEIDPALHEAVADGTYGTPAYPSTVDYQPKYFLINGEAFSNPASAFTDIGDGTLSLLRIVNAGLQTHIPSTLGTRLSLIAEDGNPYPFPKEQAAFSLPAGKTIDATLTVSAPGTFPLYDRMLNLTNAGAADGGMLTYLRPTP